MHTCTTTHAQCRYASLRFSGAEHTQGDCCGNQESLTLAEASRSICAGRFVPGMMACHGSGAWLRARSSDGQSASRPGAVRLAGEGSAANTRRNRHAVVCGSRSSGRARARVLSWPTHHTLSHTNLTRGHTLAGGGTSHRRYLPIHHRILFVQYPASLSLSPVLFLPRCGSPAAVNSVSPTSIPRFTFGSLLVDHGHPA